MSPGVLRDGRRVGGARSDRLKLLVGVVIAVTVVGLGLSDGGFFAATWTWATFVLAWSLAMIVYLRDSLSMSRLELVFVSTTAALASWIALSALWGSDTTEVRSEAGRVYFYALAVLVVLLLATRESVAQIFGGVFVGLCVVTVVGLAHYLFLYGSRPANVFEEHLLYWPVGYANAIGVLAAIGIVIAVGLATHGPRRAQPALLASLVPCASALYLSGSRGAAIALALGLGVLLVLDRRRSWMVAGVSAAVCAVAIALSAAADLNGGQSTFDSAAARMLGVELLLLVSAVAVCTWMIGSQSRAVSRLSGRPTRFGVLLVASLGLLAVAVSLGRVARAPDIAWGARADYWEVAWEQWRTHRLLGAGAGSFGEHFRDATGLGARDAHNLYLETLAELGPLGLLLLLSALLLPLIAAWRARDRQLVPVGVAAYVVFLAHAGIDWDWEMPVAALSGLFCAAALLVAARDRDRAVTLKTRPWGLAAAIGFVSVALVELLANGAISGL